MPSIEIFNYNHWSKFWWVVWKHDFTYQSNFWSDNIGLQLKFDLQVEQE